MAIQVSNSGNGARTVTLIGPTQSGKTHMIAALLINQPVQDLCMGQDAVANPRIVRSSATDSDDEEENWHRLSRHFNSMFFGRESDVEATQALSRYSMIMAWDGVRPRPPKSWVGRLLSRRRGGLSAISLELVDGRGGDLAYDEFVQASVDETAARRRDEYRAALSESNGVIICQGLRPNDYNQLNVDALNRNIESILLKMNGERTANLKSIAICLTKYESLFPKFGADALQKAVDRDEFIERMRDLGMDQIFRAVLAHGQGGRGGSGVSVRVFPVSTYGSANFYPWPQASGLLTRAVDVEDYDDPELEGLRDHYPVPISQNQARQLWRPFNLTPPLLFAATGKVTGPISVGAEELV